MKRATSLVLALLMLMSIVASMNPIEMNESEPVEDANGRADYEVWLMGANSPRESTTDMTGTVRNAVDVGDEILFDLVIKNLGDNDVSEMTITVTVDDGVAATPLFIDAEDSAVCDDTLACGIQTFTSGDYLANGHYVVRDSTGGNLVWTPAAPGVYTVSILIDALDQDTDLTNNELTYNVNVVDWYDISTALHWETDDGMGNTVYSDEPQTGDDLKQFRMTAFVNGSAEWQPRNAEMLVTFAGAFQGYGDDGMGGTAAVSMFDSDGDGSLEDCPDGPGAATCSWTVTFGELLGLGQTEDIEVYSNLSLDPPSIENASDRSETRLVPAFQTAYYFEGAIKADTNNANGVGVYTVESSLSNYLTYELVQTDYGSGLGGNHTADVVMEMMETNQSLDDKNGNNDALLEASFASYHDVRVVSVEAGPTYQDSGRLDAGMTNLYAIVEHSGSDRLINYDWAVTFNIKDSDGLDIMGSPMIGTECPEHPDPLQTYGHELLGEMIPAKMEGTACINMMLNPGIYSVTASIELLDATLTDSDSGNDCTVGVDCKVDMVAPNDIRTSHYEVLNMGPSAYLTMDEIDGAILDGTSFTFSTFAYSLNQPDIDFDGSPEPFGYTWSMVGAVESDPSLELCSGMEDPVTGAVMGGSMDCDVTINPMWFGQPTIMVTVHDYWGDTDSAELSFTVWNNYSNAASGDCWDASYDIAYAGMMVHWANFSDADDATGQTLDGSDGWDSVCTFNIDVANVKDPTDVNSESLTVTVDADPSQGHSLWYEGALGWVEMAGTTQNQVDTDTINLTWTNDGTMSSRSSSRYAVFASATLGQPPQIGIDSLTATLGAAGVIDLSWAINNSQLTGENDFGVIYINNDGAALDGDRHTFGLSQTTWTISGTHGSTYEFLVRVENGETGTDGSSLYGTPVDSGSATADGQVDPTAGASDLDAVSVGNDIQFTWTASDASDVDHWMICWSPAQHDALEVSSLVGAGSCHMTADSSTSATMNRHSGAGIFYYSVNAMDSVGNMETAASSDGLNFVNSDDPGVDPDAIGDTGAEGEIPTQAWVAIGVLVLVAVIAGAFILTRGGGEDGDDEFDY